MRTKLKMPALALCLLALSGCALERRRDGADAAAPSCGDGVVDSNEECDPNAAGWEDLCTSSCTRTIYGACPTAGCQFDEEGTILPCGSAGAYCSPICTQDSECPSMPGQKIECAGAFQCTIRCTESATCPNGMHCIDDGHCGYR